MFAKDYRKKAWDALKGNWGMPLLVSLLYSIAISALSYTLAGLIVLGGPLTVGYAAAMMAFMRTGSTKVEMLFEGFTKNFVTRMAAYILYSVYTLLWSLLFVVPGIVKMYSYSMTFYILQDNPELGAKEAITRSRQMMDGYKWKLFCLHLSFIGWLLLCVLTLGILSLWVAPYMEAANVAFYEELKKGEAAKAAPATEAA